MFTKAKISEKFSNVDGSTTQGHVVLTLTKRMSNGSETIVPSEIEALINESTGEISVELPANNDAGTVPEDAKYRVDLRIVGDERQSYYIEVPPGGGSYTLSELLPQGVLGG